MCKVVCLLLLAALALLKVNGEKYSLGECPILDPLPDFNISDFLGLWYVIQKPSTQSCLAYNITSRYEANQLDLTSIELYTRLLSRTQQEYRTTRILTMPDPFAAATMQLQPPSSFFKSTTVTVFMADYNYVALFTCRKLPVGHSWSAEILSKTPKLDLNIVDRIRTRLSSYNIDVFKMSIIRHEGCPAYGSDGSWYKAGAGSGDVIDKSDTDGSDKGAVGEDDTRNSGPLQEINKGFAL